jgi:hypothetical protein
MKKILLIATMFAACSSAFAQVNPADTVYSCKNEFGQTLNVEIQTSQINQIIFAKLTTADGEKSFNGSATLFSKSYELQSQTGESARLAVVKPVKPGHGCGRCATSDDDNTEPLYYYGQLLTASTYYNFTCQKLK